MGRSWNCEKRFQKLTRRVSEGDSTRDFPTPSLTRRVRKPVLILFLTELQPREA